MSYKLIDYLADFKAIKEKSRVEILFLAIFFTLLFVPMMHIDNSNISKRENRTLAKWKPLITKKGKVNYNFGKDFDSWFNDRFLGRKNLFSCYLNLKYNISNIFTIKDIIFDKDSGFFFLNDSKSVYNYELIVSNLNKINNFCSENGIKLYIVIFPSKEVIYSELNPYTINKAEKVKNIITLAKNKYDIDIIYPKEEMLKLKMHDYVYYKTDHHPTDSAQFLLYNILITHMKKDLPLLQYSSKKDYNIYYRKLTRGDFNHDFNSGTEYINSGINDTNILETEYLYFDYKNSNIKVYNNFPISIRNNELGNYKLFIIGDSFQESLSYFLQTSFRYIKKWRLLEDHGEARSWNLMRSGVYDDLNIIKPDALLIIIHSSDMLKQLERLKI